MNLGPTLLDLQFCLSYWFVLKKILRCSISLTAISNPCQNQCTFSRSLLMHCSVSLWCLSALSSTPFYLLMIHINTPLIWWGVIIAINWLNVNGCFIWGLLTIGFLLIFFTGQLEQGAQGRQDRRLRGAPVRRWRLLRRQEGGRERRRRFDRQAPRHHRG